MIGNKAEEAYRRSDPFDKRRKLMDAWAACCATPKIGNVVAFRAVTMSDSTEAIEKS